MNRTLDALITCPYYKYYNPYYHSMRCHDEQNDAIVYYDNNKDLMGYIRKTCIRFQHVNCHLYKYFTERYEKNDQ